MIQQAPVILPIFENKNNSKFRDIAGQFYESWRHDDEPVPIVQRIYKIIQSEELMKRYFTYRESVEAHGTFTERRMASGNERRRWYGTGRSCNLGDDAKRTKLCSSDDCGVCGIIRTSFTLSGAVTVDHGNTGELDGQGVNVSSTSSKFHDYVKDHQTSNSLYLSLLLTTVIAGEGYKTLTDGESLSKPPSGYHSTLREVGDIINYDEIVVYNEDAIRPAWLIIYG
ncbi:hypothetical protein FRB95_003664 [Tulasnella sp. JGI-2019a]|nr:hypothetical protein FRB95_003664 [Tulasnella sp. JGI-2019a]